MYKFVYDLAIAGYGLLIKIFSFTNDKANRFIEGRKVYRFDRIPVKESKIRVWVHVSSLGEFEQSRPVIEKLKAEQPNLELIMTFFSPSGFEVRKNYEKVDFVCYLPLDIKNKAKAFIAHISPDLALIVKYEFWLNHLRECFSQNIPVVYFSAIFKASQIYFNSGKKLYLPYFEKVNYFFVQDLASMQILKAHGVKNVEKVGDTRFDRVIEIASASRSIDDVEGFLGKEECIVFGSTWPSDIEIISDFINQKRDHFKIIIAPHNIKEDEINALEKRFGKTARYSSFKNHDKSSRVLIIDNMGMLSSIYRYAKYAYVGGGFRGALHNTVEAAVYGIPVFFGRHKKNRKFNEAIALVDGGGAFDIVNAGDFSKVVDQMEADPSFYEKAADFSSSFVYQNKGASEKIANYVQKTVLAKEDQR